MYKQIKITVFTGLLALPVISAAQTQICKISNIRATTPTNQFINHNNGTVTDKKTGLMWKRCIEGQIWDNITKDCKGELGGYNWQEALNQAQTVNRSGFAGKTDWRVPNIKELTSIVEAQCVFPAINLMIFPHTPWSYGFWSSSPHINNKNSAWGMDIGLGYFFGGPKYNSALLVRLVRGG